MGIHGADLNAYLADADHGRIRAWWRVLCDLRRTRPAINGPAPIDVQFADAQLSAFSRGQRGDYFTMPTSADGPDFTTLAISICLRALTASSGTRPGRRLRYSGESEGERSNGGRDARLGRSNALHIPDYGAVILERVD